MLCIDGRLDVSGCTEATYTGDYFPVAYLLPAAAISAAPDATTALWLGRGAALLACLALIALAFALTGPDFGWPTVGMLAAATPMTLFISAVINPSGLEIAANLGFIAGLLRMRRERFSPPPWVWVATTISGVLTISSWQLGPLFAAADLLAVAALSDVRDLQAMAASPRRWLVLSGAVLGAAVVLFFVYGIASGALHSSFKLTPLVTNIHAGLRQLGPTLHGAIGNFGTLSVPLPFPLSQLWLLGVLALVAVAVRGATNRDRLALAAIVGAALMLGVLFFAWFYRGSGFGMQGRYVMPALALIPIIAAEVIGERSAAVPIWGRLAAAAIVVFQLVAWWINAHHWAAGHAGLFLSGAGWSPPVGWAPPLAIAVLGATAAVVAVAPWRGGPRLRAGVLRVPQR